MFNKHRIFSFTFMIVGCLGFSDLYELVSRKRLPLALPRSLSLCCERFSHLQHKIELLCCVTCLALFFYVNFQMNHSVANSFNTFLFPSISLSFSCARARAHGHWMRMFLAQIKPFYIQTPQDDEKNVQFCSRKKQENLSKPALSLAKARARALFG